MAFFIAGGVTVPVAMNSASGSINEVGDKARTFDGTYRETIRGRFAKWSGKTILMASSDRNAVVAALNSTTQPVTCSGTMLSSSGGSVSLFTRATRQEPKQSANSQRWIVTWEAEATS